MEPQPKRHTQEPREKPGEVDHNGGPVDNYRMEKGAMENAHKRRNGRTRRCLDGLQQTGEIEKLVENLGGGGIGGLKISIVKDNFERAKDSEGPHGPDNKQDRERHETHGKKEEK